MLLFLSLFFRSADCFPLIPVIWFDGNDISIYRCHKYVVVMVIVSIVINGRIISYEEIYSTLLLTSIYSLLRFFFSWYRVIKHDLLLTVWRLDRSDWLHKNRSENLFFVCVVYFHPSYNSISIYFFVLPKFFQWISNAHDYFLWLLFPLNLLTFRLDPLLMSAVCVCLRVLLYFRKAYRLFFAHPWNLEGSI